MDCDIQPRSRQFAEKSKAVGMRVSTSMSGVMVLRWNMMNCTLWVGGNFLPRVKYLGVLFPTEGKLGEKLLVLCVARNPFRLFSIWPPVDPFWTGPTGRKPRGRSRTHWRDHNLPPVLETPQEPPGGAGIRILEEGHLDYLAEPAATATWTQISGGKRMDGWIDGNHELHKQHHNFESNLLSAVIHPLSENPFRNIPF